MANSYGSGERICAAGLYDQSVLNGYAKGLPRPRRVVRFALAVAVIASIAIAGAGISSARTSTPADVVSILPKPGEVVGVAHAVTVQFAGPIAHRAAAEHTIKFTSPATPSGTFTWLNDRVLQFTPDGFWPAHTAISVTAGGAKTSFETGAAVVSVADLDAHTFTVSIDGQVVREMPASMGKAQFPTPIGTFTAMSKERNVTFDSRTIGIPLDDPEGVPDRG